MSRTTATSFMQLASLVVLSLFAAVAQAQTVEYIHTDALGSPVAITNSSGAVIERTVYEPYGAVVNHALSNGPGFTGHVADAATSLTYMQQRYYDPAIGRFLSIDPVTTDTSSAANFNRYAYADNNPLSQYDPTGAECETPEGTPCETVTVSAPRPSPRLSPPPIELPRTRPLIPGWMRALPGFAVTTLVEFAAFGCGDSASSPSCKGDTTMENNKPPKDAKDPNGAKAPGKPGEAEGFADPKTGEEWVPGPDKRGGWKAADGRIWQPTGKGSTAHGGPHWDVQNKDGSHTNVYPGGKTR